ncbi:MAG TPA: sialidase family protein [Candidatus Hydrogenedentes bacterium]|nr:exo-alpha-sialidase [Candidatus Hydrogenedentota bacterium]HOK89098.1 sialidase family protein [Candidatus Hydrogenedentota bacterium]
MEWKIFRGATPWICAFLVTLSGGGWGMPPDPLPGGCERVLVLAPGPGNPRNSEGDFITLRDGRIVFVYTRFTGGGGDHDRAELVSRESLDNGKTWSADDRVIVSGEGGMNVMSVSLRRLRSGRIALFYLRKNSVEDCRPVIRYSTDEGNTWSDPVEIILDPIRYYVVNNDRVLVLPSGRILIPAACHDWYKGGHTPAEVQVWRSDDEGKTWTAGPILPPSAEAGDSGLQEPGITRLPDGRILMLCRTSGGSQFAAWSTDNGETWTSPRPTNIASPLSPASIEPIGPGGDLLMVWNDHRHLSPDQRRYRTPLAIAVSRDGGASWENVKNLENNPDGWYCYTAIHEVGDHVLLGCCAGNRKKEQGLALTEVIRVPITWVYTPGDRFDTLPETSLKGNTP